MNAWEKYAAWAKAAGPTPFPLPTVPATPAGVGRSVLGKLVRPPAVTARPPVVPAPPRPPVPVPPPAPKPVVPKFDVKNDTRLSRLLGRSPEQPLAGTRLFDSTTVKPRMPVADYYKHMNAAPGREAWEAIRTNLATKYQLPSLAARYSPAVDRASRLVHAADKTPLLHPLVTGARQLGYVGNTVPAVAALPQRAAKALANSRLAGYATRARQAALWGAPVAGAVAARRGTPAAEPAQQYTDLATKLRNLTPLGAALNAVPDEYVAPFTPQSYAD